MTINIWYCRKTAKEVKSRFKIQEPRNKNQKSKNKKYFLKLPCYLKLGYISFPCVINGCCRHEAVVYSLRSKSMLSLWLLWCWVAYYTLRSQYKIKIDHWRYVVLLVACPSYQIFGRYHLRIFNNFHIKPWVNCIEISTFLTT